VTETKATVFCVAYHNYRAVYTRIYCDQHCFLWRRQNPRKKLFAAVDIQVLAWEAIFLTLGALGGKVSSSFAPHIQPVLLAVWIAAIITAALTVGYLAFRRVKKAR